MRKESLRGFIIDTVLSFTAFALPVFVIYFFLQPSMARVYTTALSDGAEKYGSALTMVAVAQFLDSSLIGSLSNVRLLRSLEDNSDSDARPSLAYLLFMVLAAMSVILLVIQLLFGVFSATSYILTLIVMALISLFDYFVVEFRVKLDYKRIVLANVFLITGYAIGFSLFKLTLTWQLIYISGYALGLSFVILSTRFWVHTFPIKKPMQELKKQYLQLSGSNLMTYVVSYGDKIVLFPLFGPATVSIYASAAVACKAISVVTKPLNSVLLSYLARRESLSLTTNQLRRAGFVTAALMILTASVFFPMSSFLSKFLYPQWAQESAEFIPIIVIQVTFLAFGEMLNTVVLRLSSSKYQICISATRLIIYLFGGVILSSVFGLMGYCTAALCAEASRFILVMIIILKDSVSRV